MFAAADFPFTRAGSRNDEGVLATCSVIFVVSIHTYSGSFETWRKINDVPWRLAKDEQLSGAIDG